MAADRILPLVLLQRTLIICAATNPYPNQSCPTRHCPALTRSPASTSTCHPGALKPQKHPSLPGLTRQPRAAHSVNAGFLRLHTCEQAKRNALHRCHQRHSSPCLRTSRGSDQGLHQPVRRETSGLVGSSHHGAQCDPAREEHQALVASVEACADRKDEPGMARSLRRTSLEFFRDATARVLDCRVKPGKDDAERELPTPQRPP